jgi:hypothetical protein
MALKTKYNLNSQCVNFADVGHLVPCGYHEVVPGDTLSGSIAVNILSQTTQRLIRNRMYADVYVFYVPFRLLWADWPQFISERNTTLTIPTVTDTFNQNFEKWIINTTTNLAWLRRAYNMIAIKAFLRQGENNEDGSQGSSTDWHGTNLRGVYNRPSSFDHSVVTDVDYVDGEDITSDTTTLDLRESFAKDEFRRMRAYYGERYIDYLAALGISADGNISEDPELLAMHHENWKFRSYGVTEATGLGNTGGYFDSTVNVKLPRKFFKEHGLVCTYACIRGELFRTNGMQYPVLDKTNPEDYWSPEYESVGVKQWRENLFNQSGSPANFTEYQTPRFEDLRKGINMTANPSGGWGTPGAGTVQGMWTDESSDLQDFQRFTPSQYRTFFNTDQNVDIVQYLTQYRLIKDSPVRRHGHTRPLH